MVDTVHNEFDTRGDLAEFTDNEFIAVEFVVMGYMFLEIDTAEIAEISYDDVGWGNGWLDVSYGFKSGNGECTVGVGYFIYGERL